MEKGDWVLVIILFVVLLIIALLVTNIDLFFPTPTVKQAISQAVNLSVNAT